MMIIFYNIYTVLSSVIPAEAGIHNPLIFLDSRFRGNDDLDNMLFRFMWLGRTLDSQDNMWMNS